MFLCGALSAFESQAQDAVVSRKFSDCSLWHTDGEVRYSKICYLNGLCAVVAINVRAIAICDVECWCQIAFIRSREIGIIYGSQLQFDPVKVLPWETVPLPGMIWEINFIAPSSYLHESSSRKAAL